MDPYYITAKLTAKPGKEEEVLKIILQNIPHVRQEQGCIRYDLHRKRNDSATFLFYEIWADKDAFKAHGTAPHMLVYRDAVKDLLAGDTEVALWQAVELS